MKGGVGRPQPGVLLVSKAAGETSFSHVEAVRRALRDVPGKQHPVCHGGALDPFATGLLPVLIGSATRLFERLHELPKTYEATIQWGTETDTGDLLGTVVSQRDTSQLTPETIEAALASFLGWTDQIPPATSNKRVDGERAWQRAHRGEVVELPASKVFMFEARFTSHALPATSVIKLTSRGGFYVRSLVRDLGRALGCGAHLTALKRTAIGPWRAPKEPEQLTGMHAFNWFPWVTLDDASWGHLRAEGSVTLAREPHDAEWNTPPGFPSPTPLVLALHQRRLVSLLEVDGSTARVHTSLLPPL